MIVMAKTGKILFFVLHLILGIYLINNSLSFYVISEQVALFNKWIFLAAGVLVIFGGFNYIKTVYQRLDY